MAGRGRDRGPEREGFYEEALRQGGTTTRDFVSALRRRTAESVSRKGDDLGLWLRFLGLLMGGSAKAKASPEELAERLEAAMRLIGDPILPPEPG